MKNLREFKAQIQQKFLQKGVDKSEVNILFCEVLNCSVAELLSKKSLSAFEVFCVKRAVKKRLKGMPIQKIFKRAYFFGSTFFVTKDVLCPRPETELLVEECLKFASKKTAVLDLCTGSGAIAITIKKNCNAKVSASDISKKALKVAKKNAKSLGADVTFVRSDMFECIPQKFDIIVSNPPYIASKDVPLLDDEVKKYDPILSLDGGADGLDFYRLIAKEAKSHLNAGGKLLLEVGIGEAGQVVDLLKREKFACFVKKDYNGIERIVVGELYD